MRRVDPEHLLGLFRRLYIEVHRHRLAVGAHQHAFQHLVAAGVDLLVRHVGRDVDEVARTRFGDELKVLAPAHPRASFQDVDDAFEVTMVVSAGLGIGMDRHGARPDLLRADAGEVDGRLAIHAGRLRRVRVERPGRDDPDAPVLPLLAHAGPPDVADVGVDLRRAQSCMPTLSGFPRFASWHRPLKPPPRPRGHRRERHR